jgi:HK97 family phage portal protein
MISFLKQYLGGPQVTPNNTNLLDKIIWGQFTNDVIAWYDGKQQEFIKEGYQKNAMVYAIIRKIADKAKAAQLQTFKPTKERSRSKYRSLKYSGKDLLFHHSKVVKTKEMQLIEGADPLTDLLRKPNKNQTTSEFIDEFITWYSTTGEAFLYGVGPGSESRNAGKYQELYWLPTHLVEIKMNPVGLSFSDELILGYKLSIGDQHIIIPKEDVLHIKSTNLEWDLNGAQLRGQSPLLAGRNFLKKNNLGVEAGAKSNKNMGARGIVSPNINNVEMYQDAERTEKFRQRIDERVNGTDNRDKVVASGVPMQYTQMGLSSQAMQLIEALNYDDEKLCGLWGVNPVIFRPNATDANLEHAQKSLVTDVILPILNLFENKLEEWLNPKFNTNHVIEFDVSSFSEMQPDVKMIMDSYGDNSKISINELRVMLGWDEIESDAANTLWIPSNRIPIEDAFTGSGADFSDFTVNETN